MVSFDVSDSDGKAIKAIADRAAAMAIEEQIEYGRIEIQMDVTATHANGCRLRLLELLKADDFNFAHDVFGIRRHLNRTTGELGDHFTPRYAV